MQTDGTSVLQWILAYKDALTPAQAGVVQRVRDAAAGMAPRPPNTGLTPAPAWVGSEVNTIRAWYAARLGRSLPGTIQVGLAGHLFDSDGDTTTYAITSPGVLSIWTNHYNDCTISLEPAWVEAPDRNWQEEILAHEVFHCFQFALGNSPAYVQPEWVAEGAAEWAGFSYMADHGLPFPDRSQRWDGYFVLPLYDTDYSGLGFWASIDPEDNPWHLTDLGLQAARIPGLCLTCGDIEALAASRAAYKVVTETARDLQNKLFPRELLLNGTDDSWTLHGPNLPPRTHGAGTYGATLTVGGHLSADLEDRKAFKVAVQAPVVTITAFPGWIGMVKLPDGQNLTTTQIDTAGSATDPASFTFCARTSCPTCPGEDALPVHAGDTMYVAVTTVAQFTENTQDASSPAVLTGSEPTCNTPPPDITPQPDTSQPPKATPRIPAGASCWQHANQGCDPCTVLTEQEANSLMDPPLVVDDDQPGMVGTCDYRFEDWTDFPDHRASGIKITISQNPSLSTRGFYDHCVSIAGDLAYGPTSCSRTTVDNRPVAAQSLVLKDANSGSFGAYATFGTTSGHQWSVYIEAGDLSDPKPVLAAMKLVLTRLPN